MYFSPGGLTPHPLSLLLVQFPLQESLWDVHSKTTAGSSTQQHHFKSDKEVIMLRCRIFSASPYMSAKWLV